MFEAHPENKEHYTSRHLPYDVKSVAFSPDGRRVMVATLIEVQIWDAAKGKELLVFDANVESAAFSPDGRYMLTGERDAKAHLRDAATGQEVRRFEGHTDSIESVAFSPDGRYVLTGSVDGTARLWDAASGKELKQLKPASRLAVDYGSRGQKARQATPN
jgi:WD40 repeat protein